MSTLDAVFGALANPTRRAILERLLEGEATVNELLEPFAMSQPAISRHLRVLEEAGLITKGRDAQRRPCRLAAGSFQLGAAWMESFDSTTKERFPRLDRILDHLQRLDARLAPGPAPDGVEAKTSIRPRRRPSHAGQPKQ